MTIFVILDNYVYP